MSRAGEFVATPPLLRELAEVFLKSVGVPAGGRLEQRLAAAAARTELPEGVRRVCRQPAGEAVVAGTATQGGAGGEPAEKGVVDQGEAAASGETPEDRSTATEGSSQLGPEAPQPEAPSRPRRRRRAPSGEIGH